MRRKQLTIWIFSSIISLQIASAQFLENTRIGSVDRIFERITRFLSQNPGFQYFLIITSYWIIFYQIFMWGLSFTGGGRFGSAAGGTGGRATNSTTKEGRILASVLAMFPTMFMVWMFRDTDTATAVAKTMGVTGYIMGIALYITVLVAVYYLGQNIFFLQDPAEAPPVAPGAPGGGPAAGGGAGGAGGAGP